MTGYSSSLNLACCTSLTYDISTSLNLSGGKRIFNTSVLLVPSKAMSTVSSVVLNDLMQTLGAYSSQKGHLVRPS